MAAQLVSLRVYHGGAIVAPGVDYKSVACSAEVTANQVIGLALARYGESRDPALFELRYECKQQQERRRGRRNNDRIVSKTLDAAELPLRVIAANDNSNYIHNQQSQQPQLGRLVLARRRSRQRNMGTPALKLMRRLATAAGARARPSKPKFSLQEEEEQTQVEQKQEELKQKEEKKKDPQQQLTVVTAALVADESDTTSQEEVVQFLLNKPQQNHQGYTNNELLPAFETCDSVGAAISTPRDNKPVSLPSPAKTIPSRLVWKSLLDNERKEWILNEGTTIVGSDATHCDVVLPVSGVARFHCELSVIDGTVIVAALPGQQCWVNGTPLCGPMVLCHGNRVALGGSGGGGGAVVHLELDAPGARSSSISVQAHQMLQICSTMASQHNFSAMLRAEAAEKERQRAVAATQQKDTAVTLAVRGGGQAAPMDARAVSSSLLRKQAAMHKSISILDLPQQTAVSVPLSASPLAPTCVPPLLAPLNVSNVAPVGVMGNDICAGGAEATIESGALVEPTTIAISNIGSPFASSFWQCEPSIVENNNKNKNNKNNKNNNNNNKNNNSHFSKLRGSHHISRSFVLDVDALVTTTIDTAMNVPTVGSTNAPVDSAATTPVPASVHQIHSPVSHSGLASRYRNRASVKTTTAITTTANSTSNSFATTKSSNKLPSALAVSGVTPPPTPPPAMVRPTRHFAPRQHMLLRAMHASALSPRRTPTSAAAAISSPASTNTSATTFSRGIFSPVNRDISVLVSGLQVSQHNMSTYFPNFDSPSTNNVTLGPALSHAEVSMHAVNGFQSFAAVHTAAPDSGGKCISNVLGRPEQALEDSLHVTLHDAQVVQAQVQPASTTTTTTATATATATTDTDTTLINHLKNDQFRSNNKENAKPRFFRRNDNNGNSNKPTKVHKAMRSYRPENLAFAERVRIFEA